MGNRKIIIPDLECVTDEQYDHIINLLESLPITYEIWEQLEN